MHEGGIELVAISVGVLDPDLSSSNRIRRHGHLHGVDIDKGRGCNLSAYRNDRVSLRS